MYVLCFQLSLSRFVTDQRQGTLKIYKVRLSDEGNYACVVNTTGHPPVVSTNAHLYIKSECFSVVSHTVLMHCHVSQMINVWSLTVTLILMMPSYVVSVSV